MYLLSVYISSFLYTHDYKIMSLVVEKLTQTNFHKYKNKILKSLTEEYKATYNLTISDTQNEQLIRYCMSYMYVLVFKASDTTKLLGYFSLSRTDLNKNKSLVRMVINSLFGLVYIFDVYVYTKYRSKGIGTYLVKQAILMAIKDFSAKRIFLYIQSIDLMKFYQRNGFFYKSMTNQIDNKSLFLLENDLK